MTTETKPTPSTQEVTPTTLTQEQNKNPKTQEKETFSEAYVNELREKQNAARLSAIEAQKVAEKALSDAEATALQKAEAEKQLAEAKATLDDIKNKSNREIISAKMEALAIKAGINNTDYLKLVDLSTISLSDDGKSLTNADIVLSSMKEKYPEIFSQDIKPSSSTSTTPTPQSKSNETKNVMELSDAEYQAQKQAMLRGG